MLESPEAPKWVFLGLFGAFFVYFAWSFFRQLTTGVVFGRSGKPMIRREENPGCFWLCIVILFAFLVLAIWIVLPLIRAHDNSAR
jgi:predicted PurR-regulated permease PerM